MNSSISNSNFRVVVITMLVTVMSILLAYHFLVTRDFVRMGHPVQFGNDRIARIREYALSQKKYDVVFAGSSWMQGITSRFIPRNWFDLCLGGGSALEGCNVMLAANKFPKVLMVEASDRLDAHPHFHPVEEALSPCTIALIKLSPIFDLSYQPSSVLFGQLNMKFFGWLPATHTVRSIRRHYLVWKRNKEPLSIEDKARVRQGAIALRRRLKRIRKKQNVDIIILEIPRDKAIQNTKYVSEVNKILKSELSAREFYWFKPEGNNWDTVDGAHFTKDTAKVLARLVEAELVKHGVTSSGK
ncbi:MAG: hypothetical protein K2X93_11570 [Candidatus Obscuribacterales bacterium]|nr:hypothetical protein [Candidatus Obscuribacterales bacterium]